MFLGTHTPRLDDKGRLALPARFRPDLEGGLVICKGQERCLYVFPTDEFTRFTAALAAAPVTDRRVRDYAGLVKDCTVIGTNTRIEIWNSDAWQSYLDSSEQAFADIAEEVLPGVL